jgi:hypothetical protein
MRARVTVTASYGVVRCSVPTWRSVRRVLVRAESSEGATSCSTCCCPGVVLRSGVLSTERITRAAPHSSPRGKRGKRGCRQRRAVLKYLPTSTSPDAPTKSTSPTTIWLWPSVCQPQAVPQHPSTSHCVEALPTPRSRSASGCPDRWQHHTTAAAAAAAAGASSHRAADRCRATHRSAAGELGVDTTMHSTHQQRPCCCGSPSRVSRVRVHFEYEHSCRRNPHSQAPGLLLIPAAAAAAVAILHLDNATASGAARGRQPSSCGSCAAAAAARVQWRRQHQQHCPLQQPQPRAACTHRCSSSGGSSLSVAGWQQPPAAGVRREAPPQWQQQQQQQQQ